MGRPTRLDGAFEAADASATSPASVVALIDERGGRFSERFTLREKLGDGCSANVYVARCHQSGLYTGGQYACKLARRKPPLDWRLLTRTFEREAALLQRCAHPSVVEFCGLYQGADELALVLELAEGGDCQQLLQRHGPLAERAVHAMVGQVCDATLHVHSLGILHRDIKCENVLVSAGAAPVGPRVKLCDFGHSCALGELGSSRRLASFRGTVGYAAPEVSCSSPAWSYAADTWGVGALLYTLLGNTALRWADGGAAPLESSRRSLLLLLLLLNRASSAAGAPDFSTRNFLRVSTAAKLLLKVAGGTHATARPRRSLHAWPLAARTPPTRPPLRPAQVTLHARPARRLPLKKLREGVLRVLAAQADAEEMAAPTLLRRGALGARGYSN